MLSRQDVGSDCARGGQAFPAIAVLAVVNTFARFRPSAWAAEKADFPNYDSGSAGPKAADKLLADSGKRTWRPLEAPAKDKGKN